MKTLLFDGKFSSHTSSSISETTPLDTGEYQYAGLYEAYNYDKRYGNSIEEQQILLCIEQIHLFRYMHYYSYSSHSLSLSHDLSLHLLSPMISLTYSHTHKHALSLNLIISLSSYCSFRIQFLLLVAFYWHEDNTSMFGSFWLSFYRNYLTQAICHGLNDFPMNK